jgi:hypothetical protein
MQSIATEPTIAHELRAPGNAAERDDRFRAVLLGWPGLTICLVWSIAEAIFFFVVADVFISFVTLLSMRRGLVQIGAASVGAALGGLFLYSFAQRHSAEAYTMLVQVPWIRNGMIDDARQDLLQDGAWGVIRGPRKALPNKVYAVLAPQYVSAPAYLIATVRSRLPRFFTAWVIFAVMRLLLRHLLDAHPRTSLATFAVLWVVFYFTVVRAAVDAFGP